MTVGWVVRSAKELKASGISGGKAPEMCSFVSVGGSITWLKYLVHRLQNYEVVWILYDWLLRWRWTKLRNKNHVVSRVKGVSGWRQPCCPMGDILISGKVLWKQRRVSGLPECISYDVGDNMHGQDIRSKRRPDDRPWLTFSEFRFRDPSEPEFLCSLRQLPRQHLS
jgi:hypothetical protein